MKNILIIKLRYIGDVLLATPALRALRDGFPHARLTVLVNRGTEELLKWNPDVNEVLVLDRSGPATASRLARQLRQLRFDCVIDLTDSDRSAILTRLSGATVRIGFNVERRWRGLLYTSVVHPSSRSVHRVEHDLEAVRALGVVPKAARPVLYTSSQDEEEASRLLEELEAERSGATAKTLIMLHPGARYWFKAWPAERFAELADRLVAATDCQVLIAGDSREQELAESIQRQSQAGVKVLAGRTTLLQLAALLKRCALFIGNDNGPMHMAAALGIPVVALFGPSDPTVWGPRGDRAIVLYKGLDCSRCFHPTCDRGEESCMKQIAVDEVLAAAHRSLAAGSD
jgi:predicted lipopolysaccharide heptosyltransferase III